MTRRGPATPVALGPRLRALIAARRGPNRVSAVAREAGVSVTYLHMIIRGDREPSQAVLRRVLAAIPATMAELWAD